MAYNKKSQSDYSKKLLDPKWQKKRLEILSRDEWHCQICFDSETTLHVHHRYYETGKEPWEYDNNALVTLCSECHESETEFIKFAPKHLADSFLKAGFFAGDFVSWIEGLNNMTLPHGSDVTSSAFGWAIGNNSMCKLIIDSYFEHLAIGRKIREQDKESVGEKE